MKQRSYKKRRAQAGLASSKPKVDWSVFDDTETCIESLIEFAIGNLTYSQFKKSIDYSRYSTEQDREIRKFQRIGIERSRKRALHFLRRAVGLNISKYGYSYVGGGVAIY